MFKIYTTTTCPYGQLAQNILDEHGKHYECHSLDRDSEILLEAKRRSGWTSVPIIYEINGSTEKFIGGFTDLREYLQSGKQILKG